LVAKVNRKLLDANGGLWNSDERWAAVIAFYTALHLVESLASQEGCRNADHKQRDRYLADHPEHCEIHEAYGNLHFAAHQARYGSIGAFARQFAGKAVEKTLINKHLADIEKYCEKVFPFL